MRHRLIIACASLSALLCLPAMPLFCQEAAPASGRAIIVVEDISPSIRPYFPTLKRILGDALIRDRLGLGDYFSLITFSGQIRNADGAKIEFDRDKEARISVWEHIQPEGSFTDIGQALHSALSTAIDLKNRGYSTFEPLILFITDGEIEAPPGSRFSGKSAVQLFEDPIIGDTTLYANCYFVGLGKDLLDIKEIARLAGRSDAFLSIDDPAGLEKLLDDWLRKIPAPARLEEGSVSIQSWLWGSAPLLPDSTTALPSRPVISLAFNLVSSYAKSPRSVNLGAISVTFQSIDHRTTVDLHPAGETGRIILAPGASSDQTINLSGPAELLGRGIIKVDISAEIAHRPTDFQTTFQVEFLSPLALWWNAWRGLILSFLGLCLCIVALLLWRQYRPIKIKMELIGQGKAKTVLLRVNEKADFGGRAAHKLRLDGAWAPTLGSIKRTGISTWEILVRDAESFEQGYAGGPYAVGTAIRLRDRNGEGKSVRFSR